jgi:branched-chain amino acid aminotransferase
MQFPVEERLISVEEIAAAHAAGTLQEAFGIGTAAIIAPLACIGYQGRDLAIATGAPDSLATRLRTKLVAIQTGREPDTHNWLVYI